MTAMSGVSLAGVEHDPPLDACPICGSVDPRPFDRDHLGNRIVRCVGCGLLFMNPQYSDAHLAAYYAAYDYRMDAPRPEKVVRGMNVTEQRALGKRRCLELIEGYTGVGRLLSVGSGDGLELRIARERGWEVVGYDLEHAPALAELAQEVEVHTGLFADVELRPASLDAVMMDQVIEHLKEPADYLERIERALRPGGLLAVMTPNVSSISNRLKTLAGRLGLSRKRGKHYATSHHILYFSPRSLRRALEERFGFEVLVLRGSLKPQRKPLTALLNPWLPSIDSSTLAIARKPGG